MGDVLRSALSSCSPFVASTSNPIEAGAVAVGVGRISLSPLLLSLSGDLENDDRNDLGDDSGEEGKWKVNPIDVVNLPRQYSR